MKTKILSLLIILFALHSYAQLGSPNSTDGTFNSNRIDMCQGTSVSLDQNGIASVFANNLIDELSAGSTAGIPTTTENRLLTNISGNNVGDGIMFDINVLEDVTFKSFDLVLACCIQTNMAIYYKTGTHVGFETNASAWTLLEEFFYIQPGDFILKPLNLDLGINASAGDVVSFLIVGTQFPATVDYLNGTGLGNVAVSDANIEILEGSGVGELFAQFFPNRRFLGRVVYEKTTIEPSIDLSCEYLGSNPFDVVITDMNGNNTTCTSNITVTDQIKPTLVCKDISVVLESNGTAALASEDLLERGPNTLEIVLTGGTNDSSAPGNSDITVQVTEATTISFEWDFMAFDLPAFESFGYLLNGSYIKLTDDNGILEQSGTEMISVAAGDNFGFRTRTESNSSFMNPTQVTVDHFSFNAVGQFAPQNWTEVLTNSDGSAVINEFDGAFLSSDNCGIVSYAIDITQVTTADIGTPVSVTITGTDGSGNQSNCIAIVTVQGSLSIDDFTIDDILLYPNPAINSITLQNNKGISLNEASLIDLNGRLVKTLSLSETTGDITIDLSQLKSGLYFMNIKSNNGEITKKLIKQ